MLKQAMPYPNYEKRWKWKKSPMSRSATSINKMYNNSMQVHAKYYNQRTKRTKNDLSMQNKNKSKNKPKNATLAMNEWRHFKVTFK